MKNIIYALLLLTVCAAAPSCSTDETTAGGGTGYLKMNISTTRSGVSEQDDTQASGAYDPMEHLVVRIYNAEDGLIRKYASRELIPSELELLAGEYRVAVEAGEEVAASFTQRFYKGEERFNVTAGTTTPVEVRCTIRNTVVEAAFDASVGENFGENFHVWVAAGSEVDESAAENGTLAALKYTADGTGYFTLPEGTDHIAWRFTGTHASRGEIIQSGSVEAKAATKYTLQFTYSKDLPGYIDCTVMTIDVADPDEFDDTIVFTPDPELEGVGFNIATPQNYIPGKTNGISYKVTTTYPIQAVRLTVGDKAVDLLGGETPAEGVSVVREEEKALTVTLTDAFLTAFGGGDLPLAFHVEDTDGGTLDTTPTLRLQGLVPVQAADYDLWSNTVTLRALVLDPEASNVRFGLRKKEGTWHELEGSAAENGYYTATFAPEWSDDTDPDRPADGSFPAIYTQTEGTGVFAAGEYEYRADLNGAQQNATFTTPAGDAIYNSGMELWSRYTVTGSIITGGEVPFPNENASTAFWVSGNNKQTNALCTGQAVEGNNGSLCAALQPKTATGNVFAAGNLFTGAFDCGTQPLDTYGFARFGVQYTFTARPRALRLHLNATVTQVTNAKGPLTTDDIDPARVFVCITNWTDRHAVKSGLSYDESSFWDPAKVSSLAEGAIIGYGSKTYTESTNGWVTLTLPIHWYDKTAAPASGSYSLVISCATSAYGDYTTGSTNNRLYVEDFEWIY